MGLNLRYSPLEWDEATRSLTLGASLTALNINVAQEGTGLAQTAVIQHGSYSSAIAYGAPTTYLILKSLHITAAPVATAVMGDVNFIATSADSTGYIYPGYDYLSVGHNLVNGYASRNRVELTATCEVGETVAVLGTLNVAASTAITGYGSHTAVIAAGLLDLAVGASATVEQEATCLEIRPRIGANVAGSTCGMRVNVNCSTPNYLDYGIDIRSMSANQTAAIRVLCTAASAAIPAGIILEGQASTTSTITSGIKCNGNITYLFDFSSGTDTKPLTANATAKSGTCQGWISVLDGDGNLGYINVYPS